MIDVSLNGENHTFPPTGEFTNYVFQGGGGSDTATLTGSPAGGNSALLYINGTGQLNNTSQDFAVSVSGMTSIVANGYAGDIAQFYTKKGVTGDNTYYAYADNAAYNSGAAAEPSAGMYGTGYSNVANGFSTNIGYSNHAGDVAYFYGSTGSDTFYANADYNSSGVHTAGMLGSYTGRPGHRELCQCGHRLRHERRQHAAQHERYGLFLRRRGQRHLLRLRLSQERQQRRALGGHVRQFRRRVLQCGHGLRHQRRQLCASTSGNPDRAHTAVQIPTATGTAYFYDSPGNNVYYAYGDFADYVSSNPSGPSAGMYGSYAGFGAYANLANGFVTNIGESTNGGSDTAYFYDAPGQSTFYADAYVKNSTIPGPSAGMYGSGYANSASGFGTNVAFATPGNGSNDTAYFYDSPGNDTYYAYADFISANFNGPSAGMFGSYAASGGTGSISYADLANGFTTSVGNASQRRRRCGLFLRLAGQRQRDRSRHVLRLRLRPGQRHQRAVGGDVRQLQLHHRRRQRHGLLRQLGQRLHHERGNGVQRRQRRGLFLRLAEHAQRQRHVLCLRRLRGLRQDSTTVQSAGMFGSYSYPSSSGGGNTPVSYANSALGFGTNFGYATSDSNPKTDASDTAYLYGSTGNNTLNTDAAIAELYGSNFNDEAADFGAVTADGSEVGQGKVNTQNNTGATDYVLSLVGTWGG